MTWLVACGLALLALLFIGIPGAAIAWALRIRGLLGIAIAPLLGVTAIGVAAQFAGTIGVPWTVWTAIGADGAWLVLSVGIGIALRLSRPAPTVPDSAAPAARRLLLAGALGVAVAGAGFAINVAATIGPADLIAQSYDTLAHYDFVAWIIQHQDAATTHVGAVDGTVGGSRYYPDGWHTIVAFLVSATGVSIPLATSAVLIAETVVLWPLGLMALATVLYGRRPLVLAAAGALSGAATAFPWHFIDWGVLYANGLSTSLLPAAIALLVTMSQHRGRWTTGFVLSIVAAAIAIGSFAFTQPNTVFTIALILFPLGIVRVWQWVRPTRSRRGAGLAVAGFIALFGMAWTAMYLLPALRRVVTFHWPAQSTVPQSLGEALLSGFNGDPGLVAVPILSLLGIVLSLQRRRARWFIAAYAIAIVLYVVDNGTEGRLKSLLTGFWYTDQRRTASIVAVLSVVLAVAGVIWIVDTIPWHRFTARWQTGPRRSATIAIVLVAASLLNLLSPGQFTERALMRAVYHDQPLLTDSEAAFLAKAARQIPSGAVVANIPADGSALGYPIYGIHLLFVSLDGSWLGPWGADQRTVGSALNQIANRPDVCAAAHRLNIEYVFNLDRAFFAVQSPSEDPLWLGMRIAPGTAGFTPILTDGERGLYRVDPC